MRRKKSGSNSAVECQLPKLDVAGSIPVSRSIFFSCLRKLFQARTPIILRYMIRRADSESSSASLRMLNLVSL